MDKFIKHYKITNIEKNEDPKDWSGFISDYTFANELLSKYGGSTFNKGQFRMHTKKSSIKWSKLLTKEYFQNELDDHDLLCFGFNWQGIMYCINSENNIVTYFDPATCEFFQAEVVSLIDFFNNILLDPDYDLLADDYFIEVFQYLEIESLEFDKSIGHKIYLHLGGEDEISNLEVIDTEVLWDTQIQTAESINELPD